MRRILTFAATAAEHIRPLRRSQTSPQGPPKAAEAGGAAARGWGNAGRPFWRVCRKPRTVVAAAAVATLLGWGTASALSGPEPVPDSYGGLFVLTYKGQNTEVFNVSGCDLAPTGAGTAIVKPCRFEVPANAASELKQKIVGALGSGTPPASNTYALTHYEPDPADPARAVSDYAARGQFTISQVTLPVLDPLGASGDTEKLGIELTPTGGADVQPVSVGLPSLSPLVQPFQVGTDISCGGAVPVVPSPVQLSDFATTPLRSLSVSVDTSGQPAVKTGSVRISQSDSKELKTARDWLAISPPPGQAPSGSSQVRTLTLSLASYDCSTGTYSNQLTISLPVAATSMDPFARTDRYFTLGLASALRPGAAPNTTWR